ncbi:MAG: PEP-CTERM sorting domain-containing protein [Gammaproteobacteria bacterium]|nr:PEP-CTERM sorting domain-containing protein [Gammaproteobacteria bacterium]
MKLINKKQTTLIGTMLLALALPHTASANLITNGDFEAGNTGFNTDLNYNTGSLLSAGVYTITTDPSLNHPAPASYGDNTTGSGNMFAVNGSSTPGSLVWGTSIAVTTSTEYDFGAYLSSWLSSSPAQLQFSINGDIIGDLTASATTGVWDFFFANWNSGTATTANIQILNNNTSAGGNDFALDDIYFGAAIFSNPATAVPEPASFLLIAAGLVGIGFTRRKRQL